MKIEVFNNIYVRMNDTSREKDDVWFLHGLGESGLSFKEVFESPLNEKFNIFIPDFPGFGVSPPSQDSNTLNGAIESFLTLKNEFSSQKRVCIVGHSLGGIIGTLICHKYPEIIYTFTNVEGNLTEGDTFYTKLASKESSAVKFYNNFIKQILDEAPHKDCLERYYASLRFCNPEAFFSWAREGYSETMNGIGDKFKNLNVPKLYLWGGNSLSNSSVDFLNKHKINNFNFPKCHHWPMIEKPEIFYKKVLNLIENPK